MISRLTFVKMQRNSIFPITEGSLSAGTTKVLHTLEPVLIHSNMQSGDGNHMGAHLESNFVHVRNL